MTSLTGFDALLRNKTVVVYGRPFYAGWGLTMDQGGDFAEGRRLKRLSLQELIVGTLLVYPFYYDWQLGGYTDCESTLHHLVAIRENIPLKKIKKYQQGYFQRQLRKIKILVRAEWLEK